MDIKDFAPIEFPRETREMLYWANGPNCPLCNDRILNPYSIKSVERYTSTIHHVIFKSLGGLGLYANGLVCCRSCHSKLHDFLMCFDLTARECQFFTCVYVWLFLPRVDNQKIYRRFSYSRYSKSFRGFVRMFRARLKKQNKMYRMFLAYYAFHSGNYVHPIVAEYIKDEFNPIKLRYHLDKFKLEDGRLPGNLMHFAHFEKNIKAA